MVPKHGEVWALGDSPHLLFIDIGDDKMFAALILETGVYENHGHWKGAALPDNGEMKWIRVHP